MQVYSRLNTTTCRHPWFATASQHYKCLDACHRWCTDCLHSGMGNLSLDNMLHNYYIKSWSTDSTLGVMGPHPALYVLLHYTSGQGCRAEGDTWFYVKYTLSLPHLQGSRLFIFYEPLRRSSCRSITDRTVSDLEVIGFFDWYLYTLDNTYLL